MIPAIDPINSLGAHPGLVGVFRPSQKKFRPKS